MNRTLFFFNFVFCECFARDPVGYAYTGGSVRRPHLTYGQRNFCTHFFDVATKPLLSEIAYDILTRAGPKRLSKNRFFFGTGSRRGVTPGRLGAQNRWFLKGFRPEGSLHRTRGRDRPGALAPRRVAAQLMMMIMMMMMMMMMAPRRLFLPPPMDIA